MTGLAGEQVCLSTFNRTLLGTMKTLAVSEYSLSMRDNSIMIYSGTAMLAHGAGVIQTAALRLLVLGLLIAAAPALAQGNSPDTTVAMDSTAVASDRGAVTASEQGDVVADSTTDPAEDQAVDSQSSQAKTGQLSPERVALLTRELADRQAAIQDLQSDYGVYTPELMEAYHDLGTLFLELDEPENAARIFNDALQIARINTGLYSEAQLPYINSLLNSYANMEQWQEVDNLHHLRLLTHDRLFQPDDERYLTAAELYGEWKLRLLRQNLLQQGRSAQINMAEDLSEFYERVLVRTDASEAVSKTKLAAIVYGKTQSDLALAEAISNMPYTAFEGTVPRYVAQTRCRNVPNAQGQMVRECYQVRAENPRYRQSQRQAKRMALTRYSAEIADGIERLRSIRDTQVGLTDEERQWLDGHRNCNRTPGAVTCIENLLARIVFQEHSVLRQVG